MTTSCGAKTYKGRFGRIIELHGDSLTLRRRGATREIPLDAVTGVEFSPSHLLKDGWLRLEVAFQPSSTPFGSDRVQFLHKHSGDFTELVRILRERIATNQAAGIDPTAVPYQRTLARGEHQVTSGATFEGITLKEGRVISPHGGGPLAGAKATVDTAGALSRRISATRVLMTGVLALAWRKKIDDRELYLSIEGQGWAISVPVSPAKSAAARRFAANVNALGSRLAKPPDPSVREPDRPSSPPASPLDAIKKLSALHDAGALTSDEFEQSKAALLRRLQTD